MRPGRHWGTLFATFAMISSAGAADMAVKAPPVPPATPAFSWTGLYVGGNFGYGWNDPTVTFSPNDALAAFNSCGGIAGSTCPPSASLRKSGATGGFQGGYNWQLNGNWLTGVEADLDWFDHKATGTSTFVFAGPFSPLSSNFAATQNVKWLGTVRGRVGYSMNNVLLYATGGFAYAQIEESVALNSLPANNGIGFGFGFLCTAGPSCFVGSSSRIATGWTAGGGLEYALSDHVTVKAEYLYMNLGGDTVNVVAQNANGAAASSSFSAAYGAMIFQTVRGGVNWKF